MKASTRCGRVRTTGPTSSGSHPRRASTAMDASFLGQTTHVQNTPATARPELHGQLHRHACPPAPAASTTSTSTWMRTTICPPIRTSTRRASRRPTGGRRTRATTRTGWASSIDWAFEDPFNNRIATPFNITYREPDLKVTNITVPPNVTSGETIPITYTVTNQGTRATRTASWTDRIFLSQDPSLDIYDTVLGSTSYGQVLAAGSLLHRNGQRPCAGRHPGHLLTSSSTLIPTPRPISPCKAISVTDSTA